MPGELPAPWERGSCCCAGTTKRSLRYKPPGAAGAAPSLCDGKREGAHGNVAEGESRAGRPIERGEQRRTVWPWQETFTPSLNETLMLRTEQLGAAQSWAGRGRDITELHKNPGQSRRGPGSRLGRRILGETALLLVPTPTPAPRNSGHVRKTILLCSWREGRTARGALNSSNDRSQSSRASH